MFILHYYYYYYYLVLSPSLRRVFLLSQEAGLLRTTAGKSAEQIENSFHANELITNGNRD